ncbi:MAG: serine hydrolase [Alistipes sp.]|nr:serine hydrolase [Alistipes sp.]
MKRYLLFIIVGILSLQSCVVTRAIKYGNASVDDYTVFEQDTVAKGLSTFKFADAQQNNALIDTLKFDIYLSKSDTLLNLTLRETMDYMDVPSAAIVIQNDTILFEHYSGGWNRDSQSCIFSVTKTITSMLCGIALKDGYIKSLSDPVTDYIPELKDADPTFAKLKIEHLLDMTAGLKFNENYSWNPFSKMAKLYFGNNTLKVLKSLKFINTPGENFSYDSATTALLGIVIERATGKSYAQYLSEKVWRPLGMERDALIGLDSKKHHTAKSFAGLTTNVRDLAKIGKLFLNNGVCNGVQIVDLTFVNRCLSTHTAGISGKAQSEYSYSWYWGVADEEDGKRKFFNTLDELKLYYKNHPEKRVRQIKKNLKNGYFAVLHNGGFWGFGLYGQVLYVNPEKNMVAVFLGADRLKDFDILFEQLSTYLD